MNPSKTKSKSLDKILSRGVEKILPSKEALRSLLNQKKLRIYQGFDPTGRLHVGHGIGLRKLMEFANLGHEVIFLFGTGTVLVGDPSKRDTGRKIITEKEIEKNIKIWVRQAESIVDFSKVKIMKNGDWLTKLKLKEIIQIASNISALQLFKRDSFKKRIARGDTVWYHETMYPLFQGYDSVYLDVDLEIGGTDQEFNMLIGRELQKKINQREKFILTIPMITGTDGKQMSKSSGNCIWLDDPPNEMFGKIMSILDEQIIPYMSLLANMAVEEVTEFKKGLITEKIHPLEAKKRLGVEIVSIYHSREKAINARASFKKTFQQGKLPEKPQVFQIDSVNKEKNDLLSVVEHFTQSKTQAKRLIFNGAVDINGLPNKDPKQKVVSGDKIKIGKKDFIQVRY